MCNFISAFNLKTSFDIPNIQDGKGDNFRDLQFNEEVFKVMRLSQHPPHLQEDIGFGGRTYTPTFIYCWYDKERANSAGSVIGPYGERFKIVLHYILAIFGLK